MYRRLVGEKRERVSTVLANPDRKSSLQTARTALAPAVHLNLILEHFGMFLGHLTADPTLIMSQGQNFRIGLYVEDDGYLVPLEAISINDRRRDPFNTYQTHRDHYNLSETNAPAHLVRCIQQRALIICEDCQVAADAGEFIYFNDTQRSYLKSMLAYPLLDFWEPRGLHCRGAVGIDTDVAGYFCEADRELLRALLDELAVRLQLESAIRALIDKPG